MKTMEEKMAALDEFYGERLTITRQYGFVEGGVSAPVWYVETAERCPHCRTVKKEVIGSDPDLIKALDEALLEHIKKK